MPNCVQIELDGIQLLVGATTYEWFIYNAVCYVKRSGGTHDMLRFHYGFDLSHERYLLRANANSSVVTGGFAVLV